MTKKSSLTVKRKSSQDPSQLSSCQITFLSYEMAEELQSHQLHFILLSRSHFVPYTCFPKSFNHLSKQLYFLYSELLNRKVLTSEVFLGLVLLVYARTVEMLSESIAMTVHLNSFSLSSAQTCCWTVTACVWRCSSMQMYKLIAMTEERKCWGWNARKNCKVELTS